MAISDYVPNFGESNLSTYYRNVLGVPVRKRIVVAVLAVFGLFLVFVCGLILAKSENRSTSNHAAYPIVYIPFTRSMNVSVDPCTNFYEFTCGLWSKNEEVLKSEEYQITNFKLLQTYFNWKKRVVFENSQMSSDLPRVVNDSIRFFKLCDSEESDPQLDINYLKSYFKQIMGGWPVLHPKQWNDTDFDWARASALLVKSLGIKTIIDVFSIVDDNNSSRRILYLKYPEIQNTDYSQHDSTTQMMYSVLTLLSSHDFPDILNSIESIMKSEIQWQKTFSDLPAESDHLRTTFKELKGMLPGFDWMFYFQTLMNDTLNKLGTDIFEEDVVLVDNFKVIKRAVTFFNSDALSKEETANLFGWLAVQKIWFLIPGVFKMYSERYGYDSNEVKEARRSKCFETLFELYDSSVDYLFVRNASHSCLPDGKVLVHYLKNALRNRLHSSDWLDDSTKESAILKLDSMKSIIGFKSYLSNKTEFDDMFDERPPVKPSLLEVYFDTNLYFVSRMVSVLKTDKLTYVMPRSVTHVSAYYSPQKNIFTLPLSMYNRPFYHSQGPWYLNFGALGAVVGHEIMHGFDRIGCQRGETGSYKKWWSSNATEIYEQRGKCFFEQYSSYLDFNFKSKDADQTLDEDIADSEGLHLAYLAYQQWIEDNGPEEMYSIFKQKYSAEQMFFISFGSIWCSKIDPQYQFHLLSNTHNFPKWRVNGAVSNSEYFSRAFHCPKGSPMNPDRKCAIW